MGVSGQLAGDRRLWLARVVWATTAEGREQSVAVLCDRSHRGSAPDLPPLCRPRLGASSRPTFPTSPYKGIGNAGYGETPEGQLEYYFDTSNLGNIETIINSYYHSLGVLAGNVDILKSWDRDTRIEGPLMVIILILALLAPFLASGGPRRLAILCGIVSAVLIVAPILVIDYDWRFMIPAFGPLTAGAAIGGFEVWRRTASLLRSRKRYPRGTLPR